ncbi:MAG: hypothetical protein CO030_04110 [Candidatus Magasanikbacteria bacterium CG_4_9_14_0_2_um_filter_42_11]|uniref:Four helix bundle protein n=1 Tax=Candidatus Magasanikbacteria bacterium CG_4_9_14_0_2_um_filter_42_11 TaxID=1974643 RepID=A0A2M8F954_9BACT|nr:MAG: hypothetical protein COU34_03400 [Candidatus Magasanikbacteria bacterium CG10_big_fil_rev_8_21_14_0_10_43_9]PIY92941.1 MAG: hypothetical protein COY70_00645 [Candidatus Magasanikbacteria bacterium CG_4_10_14_0_8_um_filter_42_12]PJC52209.1 MAG: hypothetical protein CO030_04110 [Candidatus Magasanikbacteria bacterium CG_4_9_14_0_2_um_filter_42_11]
MEFFEISYGSAKECKYLLFLAVQREWITDKEYSKGLGIIDEICSMLFSMLTGLQRSIGE